MKQKGKRILAWIGIGALAAVYLATFFLGIFGSPAAAGLFKACIVLTVVVPVLIYAILLTAKLLSGRKNEEDKP